MCRKEVLDENWQRGRKMNNRRRYLRPLVLFAVMAVFSLSLIGHLDNRLHIGGFDWDFETDDRSQNSLGAKALDDNLKSNDGLIDNIIIDDNEADSLDIAEGSATFLEESIELSDSKDEDSERAQPAIARVDSNNIPHSERPQPEAERKKPTILVHTVRSGETLWDIANSYGISVNSIMSSNDIANSNRIRIGQELDILTVKGVLHEVAYGESVWEIAQRYGVPLAEITEVNSIADPGRIRPGEKIVVPGATQLLIRDVLVVNGQLQKAFDWPARARISSPFGPRWGGMHNGIDIAVVTGTPIRAAADGRVIYSGANGGYGIMVMIDHGSGVETRYAHHSRNVVSVGQTVKRGDIIAYSGNTGNSTGPHLHFEIRQNNKPVDPIKFLK